MKALSLVATLLAITATACSQGSNPAAPSAGTAAAPAFALGAAPSADTMRTAAAPASLLAAVRQATAKYHDVDKAIADGYLPPSADECVEVPGLGGMGIHSVNPALASDLTVDPTKPELLLYAPKNGGGFKLVGVEWFVPVADPSNPPPQPVLFGQGFDGPMPGHEPGQPWHYDLHVWTWEPNPSGMFAQFNPNVSCSTK